MGGMMCELCGGECFLLGALGPTAHYRCRQCGSDTRLPLPAEAVGEEDDEEETDTPELD